MRTSHSRSSIENGNIRISVDSDVSFTTISSSCGSISRDTDIVVNVTYALLFHICVDNFTDDSCT